jgi:MFS transporter, PPP family, 3-phenylpropionic acid transporter
MSEKRNPLYFRFVYFLIFAGDALFSPFYSYYFDDAGLANWQESLLLACVPFFLFVGDYVFSLFATSFRRNLMLLRIGAACEVLGFLAFGFMKSFPGILVLTIFTAFFDSAIFQVMDATSVVAVKKVKTEYWTVRIFGSIAYAAALIGGSFFIKYVDYTVLFGIASILVLAGLVFSFFIYPVVEDLPQRDAQLPPSKPLPLWKNKSFILYFLFNMFFSGGVNILGYILVLYLKAGGVNNSEYSLWYGLRVVMEILSMLLMPLFFKIFKKKKTMLLIGSGLFVLSSLLACLVPNPTALMSSSFMIRGFANAFFLVYYVTFLQSIVGDEHIGKACTLTAAACNAFNGIGNLVADSIYSRIGFIGFFWILFGIQLLGCLFLLLIKEKKSGGAPVVQQ